MTEMTFAPGWTQIIDTDGVREREDLASFISDTFKGLHGIRPRWMALREWSLDDLRAEAKALEVEVIDSIAQAKRDAHERMLEANRVAVIYRAAKKRLPRTHKPFANIKEIL